MRSVWLVLALLADLVGSNRATMQSSPAATTAGTRIPLCPGLTLVTAVSEPHGDYESIKRIESVTPAGIRLTYSAEVNVPDAATGKASVKNVRATRAVATNDLLAATRYARAFGEKLPDTLPGTTALGTSTAVLKALQSRGETELSVTNEGLLEQLARAGGSDLEYETSTIRRVARVTVPVIVNGSRVELPALHARATFFDQDAEFFFLDDPDNPIALRYVVARGAFADLMGEMTKLFGGAGSRSTTDSRDRLQVVRISYDCSSRGALTADASAAAGLPGIERALAETGRADVYDIFFSFNSDRIRDESKTTLEEIARLLMKYPNWKLAIGGHTDNIASDAFNVDLSRRRAIAVKDALVKQHKIDPARLSTTGHGESSPKDTNETLEGRARNRRVELVRSAA